MIAPDVQEIVERLFKDRHLATRTLHKKQLEEALQEAWDAGRNFAAEKQSAIMKRKHKRKNL